MGQWGVMRGVGLDGVEWDRVGWYGAGWDLAGWGDEIGPDRIVLYCIGPNRTRGRTR